MITIDTLRADHLGCYGYSRNTSPRIDEFAKESLLFTSFHAQSSETTPSVSSIMTGYYPHETKVYSNINKLPDGALTLAEILEREGYETAGVVSNSALNEEMNFQQGFGTYDDEMTDEELVRKLPERVARKTTDAAIHLLRRHRHERLFLWVHYIDPHGPYTPPPEYGEEFAKVPGEGRDLRVNGGNTGRGGIPRYQELPGQRNSEHYVLQYDREIRYMDAEVGRLLDEIRSLGMLEKSLVLLTADHGEAMGERDYYFSHGETLDRGLIHVPMMIHGKNAKGVSERTCQHIDIVPTVLGALDIKVAVPLQGRDMLADGGGSDDIYSELRHLHSLSRGSMNLVFDARANSYALYDLAEDLRQERDLIRDGKHSKLVESMKASLHRLKSRDLLGLGREDAELDEAAIQRLRSLGYLR